MKTFNGMQWETTPYGTWIAKGEYGSFRINKGKGLFWAKYVNSLETYSFNLPPRERLLDAKNLCESCKMWEKQIKLEKINQGGKDNVKRNNANT